MRNEVHNSVRMDRGQLDNRLAGLELALLRRGVPDAAVLLRVRTGRRLSCSYACVEYKGDWEWHVHQWQLTTFWPARHECHLCHATRSTAHGVPFTFFGHNWTRRSQADCVLQCMPEHPLLCARFESRCISGPLCGSFVVDGAAWKFQRGSWFGRTAAGSVCRVQIMGESFPHLLFRAHVHEQAAALLPGGLSLPCLQGPQLPDCACVCCGSLPLVICENPPRFIWESRPVWLAGFPLRSGHAGMHPRKLIPRGCLAS